MDAIRGISEKVHSDMPATSSFDTLDKDDRESRIVEIAPVAETRWQYLRRYFTTRDGWIGNYVCRGEPGRQSIIGLTLSQGLCISCHSEYMATKQEV
jgi:hypothetical protein